jgi:hypothetical protein
MKKYLLFVNNDKSVRLLITPVLVICQEIGSDVDPRGIAELGISTNCTNDLFFLTCICLVHSNWFCNGQLK